MLGCRELDVHDLAARGSPQPIDEDARPFNRHNRVVIAVSEEERGRVLPQVRGGRGLGSAVDSSVVAVEAHASKPLRRMRAARGVAPLSLCRVVCANPCEAARLSP